MNILKELSENKTILLLIPSTDYNDVVIDVAKQLSEKSLCYVTLNKTYSSLQEIFKKKKVNTGNIVFIDAISKNIKETRDQTDRCYFVNSPSALTDLSLAISKLLSHKFEYLIFDSLSNLIIYQGKSSCARFISSIVNKIEDSSTKAVFYALIVKEHEELIKECSMFVDKVIDLSK